MGAPKEGLHHRVADYKIQPICRWLFLCLVWTKTDTFKISICLSWVLEETNWGFLKKTAALFLWITGNRRQQQIREFNTLQFTSPLVCLSFFCSVLLAHRLTLTTSLRQQPRRRTFLCAFSTSSLWKTQPLQWKIPSFVSSEQSRRSRDCDRTESEKHAMQNLTLTLHTTSAVFLLPSCSNCYNK